MSKRRIINVTSELSAGADSSPQLKIRQRRPHQQCNIVPFALGQVERLSEPLRFLSHTPPQKTCLLLPGQGHYWELNLLAKQNSEHAEL